MNDSRKQKESPAWLSCSGKIEVDNGVRIVTDVDICKYYQWFIKREFWNTVKTQIPKHKGHITIFNPRIHGEKDLSEILYLKDREVNFEISPEQTYGSSVNFWIPARAEVEREIKYFLSIEDGPNFWGLHLTICNRKFK